MIRELLIIFILLFSLETRAQNWEHVSTDKFNDYLTSVLFDSIHNNLIASGRYANSTSSLTIRGTASWNGLKWDSLSGGINTDSKYLHPTYPDGGISACIPYGTKLLVGGFFKSIGYVNTTSLALWDGVKFDSLPKRAFRNGKTVGISSFLKKGGLIYIAGSFDTIGGQPAKGLATWDGTNFNVIPLPIGSGFQNISSIVEYHNDIYIYLAMDLLLVLLMMLGIYTNIMVLRGFLQLAMV